MSATRYKILERLGGGGQAEVFRGVAESIQGFKKSVAIKRVLPNLTNNPQFVRIEPDKRTADKVTQVLYHTGLDEKLPLLLAVARNEKHALKDEANDLLELYVEEDYGTNWNQWEDATKKYLKEHGAEETAPIDPATAQP